MTPRVRATFLFLVTVCGSALPAAAQQRLLMGTVTYRERIALPASAVVEVRLEDVTRPEQGAVYRLSGDRNPIHIDPDFAKMAGFEKPFVHGLCTYGFVGRAILKALCGGDPARFLHFEARFADQVYFGDTIITKMWKTGAGEAIVQAESQKGNVVLSQARAKYR